MQLATICHIIFEHSVFDARVYFKEMLSLARAGYQVVLLAPQISDSSMGLKQERLDALPQRFTHPNIIFKTYVYNKKIPKWRGMRHRRCLEELLQAALEINADIYHIHEDGLSMQAAVALKRALPATKIIVDFHEFFTHTYRRYSKKKAKGIKGSLEQYLQLENALLRCTDMVITSSEFITHYYQTVAPELPMVTVMNCQSTAVFSQDDYAPDTDAFIIVHEGRMLFDRGLKLIIETARCIKNDTIRFLIIGNMPKRETAYFKRVTAEYGIADKFILIGHVPYWDVSGYLGRAHVGINFLLSRNAQTGIALKFFNYLRYGIPILSLAHPLISDILTRADAGIIVPNDPEKIAAYIETLQTNRDRLQELTVHATQLFSEQYNWTYEEQKLLDAYHHLLSREVSNG